MVKVLVVNPNSNPTVTAGIDAAVGPLRSAEVVIETMNLEGTPFGIESQEDVESVSVPVVEHVKSNARAYDAFVISCFSDPGLYAAREVTPRPVFGIAHSGLLTAAAIGGAVGVISIKGTSLPRHWRMYRAMGIANLVVGDRPIDTSVAELANEDRVYVRMEETGRKLVEEDGADVLVLGCAGMARYRLPLEAALGVTVVEPSQAAVAHAIGAATLGLKTR